MERARKDEMRTYRVRPAAWEFSVSSHRVSEAERQIIARIAKTFGTTASLGAIRALPSSIKREIKIWLGELILHEGVEGGDLNVNGRALDDFIDRIGF
jgi:hypothetical protein